MFRSLSDVEILGDRELGHGAFSVVKRCRLKRDGRVYALKVVDLSALGEQDLDNMRREIELHRSLVHPNIIRFYDCIQEGSFVYILLEYAANSCLYYYINTLYGMPEQLALRFFYQTVLAVKYLHEHNVIHRDIKPENIIFDADLTAKLCDFGWAAVLESTSDMRYSVCGTFEYMSPEIFYEQSHSTKTDIWCLGILLYEMLHGEFSRETAFRRREFGGHSRGV